MSELEALLLDYCGWLTAERGLAEATMVRYLNCARRFLSLRADRDGAMNVESLTGVEATAFLLTEARRCSVGAAKGRVAELRALLRYLYVRGSTPTLLSESIPPVAGWHDTAIPPFLSRRDVEALVNSCDRSTAAGIRDYAMLMLLAGLGMRSIEVARLELSDVDWRAGEIRIRGKARRTDRMPLPVEVGNALAFTSLRFAPSRRTAMFSSRCGHRSATCEQTCSAMSSNVPAGVPGCRKWARIDCDMRWRRMLSDGVPLIDISAVLRHQNLATTALYAKVDFGPLQHVAQPWPGALR